MLFSKRNLEEDLAGGGGGDAGGGPDDEDVEEESQEESKAGEVFHKVVGFDVGFDLDGIGEVIEEVLFGVETVKGVDDKK